MRRTGHLSDRIKLALQRRVMVGAWRLSERLGFDIAGATEGPRYVIDDERRKAFEELVEAAQAGDGTLAGSSVPYPVHELLTYLVVERRLLLHGSNDADLTELEPRPARDYRTELLAVVACDDGIWPIFYAVLARRDQAVGVFTACTQLGRPPRLRRFYMFAVFGADPEEATAWTRGAVYALARDGFRREWGNEWVRPEPVRPLLRVLVGLDDFPLRDAVLAATPDDLGSINRRLREAKRGRAEVC
jgi:hypothetical protein